MDDTSNEEVEHLEFIVGSHETKLRPPGVRRLTPAEMRMSMDLMPDGTVQHTGWSFAVAYEIPEDRRESFGADAISLLYDEDGWHVECFHYDDDGSVSQHKPPPVGPQPG
jgi:hypothetical protein